MKYIYHHLGLGDHIICNGLVRKFASEFENISLFCKPHNKESVEFMYRDLNNLSIISLSTDSEVINFLQSKNMNDVIKVGFDNMYSSVSKNFDASFYNQFKIDFEVRWSNFKIDRDVDREQKIFTYFDLIDGQDYIFVHDDDRFQINHSKFQTNGLRIIRPNRDITDNIFDYMKVIECAKEAHLIESSFLFIIDSLNLNSETYAHRYARKQGFMETPIYKYVKKIIN